MDALLWAVALIVGGVVLFIVWAVGGYVLRFLAFLLPSLATLVCGIFLAIVLGGPVGGVIVVASLVLAVYVGVRWSNSPTLTKVHEALDKVFPFEA